MTAESSLRLLMRVDPYRQAVRAAQILCPLSAAVLAATLMGCNKAPAKSVTYQCRSPEESNDVFVRLYDDFELGMDTDPTQLNPLNWTTLSFEGDAVTWTKQDDSRTATFVLHRNTGDMDTTYDPGHGGKVVETHYSCTPP